MYKYMKCLYSSELATLSFLMSLHVMFPLFMLQAKEKLDSILQRTKPPMLKRMGIRKMGLGGVPPKIHSIRCFSQDSSKTKVYLSVEFT